MAAGPPARKGIKDVFYETRVLTGRDYTVRRFAAEVLGGSVDPVMLGYIEKGKRFPSEALVRRLAAMRKQDPHELLRAAVARPHAARLRQGAAARAARAARRRRRRGRRARGAGEPGDRGAARRRRAGSRWRVAQAVPQRHRAGARGRRAGLRRARQAACEETLRRARARRGRARQGAPPRPPLRAAGHARSGRRWRSSSAPCSPRDCSTSSALPDADTGTYLRNHYLNIDPARLPEFQQRLEQALRALARGVRRRPVARSALSQRPGDVDSVLMGGCS